MTKAAVMQGVYVDCKFMPGLKSARIAIDIPIEHSNEFLRMFGAPDRASPVAVAIARLNAGEESGDVRKSETVSDRSRHQNAEAGFDSQRPRTITRSQIAALKCKDVHFQEWLFETMGHLHTQEPTAFLTDEDFADAILKEVLGITSKRELDTMPHKENEWNKLLASYDYRNQVRA